jgi:DNA-directed RNA polymerase subunit RPC12/RpoP
MPVKKRNKFIRDRKDMKKKCAVCKKEFDLPDEKRQSYPSNPKTARGEDIKYICPECSKLTASM